MQINLLFPSFRVKAMTMSFDDCESYDRQLSSLLRSYGFKATFYLISGQLGLKVPFFRYGADTVVERVSAEELPETYAGMEVGSHTVSHKAPVDELEQTVVESMKHLSALWGKPVTGLAYPGGVYTKEHIAKLKSLKVLYARTATPSYDFELPPELLSWNPTCHYADRQVAALSEKFLQDDGKTKLFHLYGHSYELENPAPGYGWETFESLCKKLSGKENIWYAANGEIAEYLDGFSKLSVAQNKIENRADCDLFFLLDKTPVKLKKSESITIN